MEVKVRHTYDQSVDTVFQAFGNKASVERKFKDLGARNIRVVTCKLTKTSLDLVTSREVPVNAPSLLKKFIGEWNLANQQEQWKGVAGKSYQGHATISIKGVPVTITAKMNLASSGKGCVNEVTLTIESSIPFIGGKLAEFVGQTSATELQKQYELIKASLASAPPAAKTATKAVTKTAVKTPAKKAAAAKPVAKAGSAKSAKAPAVKTPAKKTVAAKNAVAKPAVKAAPAKPSVKAAAVKPAAKKAVKAVVKKAVVASKPVAKKAVAKVAPKPAAAKKVTAKKAAPKKAGK